MIMLVEFQHLMQTYKVLPENNVRIDENALCPSARFKGKK